MLAGEYKDSVHIARRFLGLDASEVDRTPFDELIAHFHIVVALILANDPHEKELEHLQVQIESVETIFDSIWDFDVLDLHLKRRQLPLSVEKVRTIQSILARMKVKLGGG